jgi:hypothetical protein
MLLVVGILVLGDVVCEYSDLCCWHGLEGHMVAAVDPLGMELFLSCEPLLMIARKAGMYTAIMATSISRMPHLQYEPHIRLIGILETFKSHIAKSDEGQCSPPIPIELGWL